MSVLWVLGAGVADVRRNYDCDLSTRVTVGGLPLPFCRVDGPTSPRLPSASVALPWRLCYVTSWFRWLVPGVLSAALWDPSMVTAVTTLVPASSGVLDRALLFLNVTPSALAPPTFSVGVASLTGIPYLFGRVALSVRALSLSCSLRGQTVIHALCPFSPHIAHMLRAGSAPTLHSFVLCFPAQWAHRASFLHALPM